MAIGDQNDIFSRLKSLLPPWFGDQHPNLDALLKGATGTAFSYIYNFYVFAKAQTRIKTATGEFLDLISADFFGTTLPRKPNENDNSFRNRILARLLQAKATRYAMINALYNLTGRYPFIFEPRRDGGFYGKNSFYNHAEYGSRLFPYEAWIVAFRPQSSTLNPDYYTESSFYSAQSFYGDSSRTIIQVSDQDILDLIDEVKPIATIMHVIILD